MIETKEIEYIVHNKKYKGLMCVEQNDQQPKPVILIAHDWEGRHEGMNNIAKKIAQLGYVGFALDLYGNGRTGATKDERRHLMTELLNDRAKIIDIINHTIQILTKQPEINSDKIGLIGYCLGGLCALDYARSGANIRGAVSFHGRLNPPKQTTGTKITTSILVLHGFDDPLVSQEELAEFMREMKQKQADWQLHIYGGVQHSFTNPKAHDHDMGLFYNALADQRAWQSLKNFLDEIF
tara:strand:+ start:833 stop:1546 length:714 start_codon:yes stop_codon:yes gene_type:complete